jgi:hypothetical protein
MQLGALLARGKGKPVAGADAVVSLLFPWLAGHVALAALQPASLLIPAALGLSYAAARWVQRPTGHMVLGLSVALLLAALLAAELPSAAIGAAVLLLPQFLLVPWVGRGLALGRFTAFARPWLMAAMLVAALAL